MRIKKKKIKWKIILEIFTTFFKISPVTFGGGFAIIPVLEAEVVDKKRWVDREAVIDIFAVSQSVPGAIAVNSAIFLGYRLAGVPGALAAMLGILIPTFCLILVLAVLLVSFQRNTYVQAALKGIRPVIVALIAAAAYKMGKTALTDKISWAICIVGASLPLIFKDLNLVLVILSGAVSGLVITRIMKAREKICIMKAAVKSDNAKSGKSL